MTPRGKFSAVVLFIGPVSRIQKITLHILGSVGRGHDITRLGLVHSMETDEAYSNLTKSTRVRFVI